MQRRKRRVGQTEIAYELRRTATASKRRITVTPGYVEVLALTTDDDAAINNFLDRKRQWLFDTVRELEEVTAKVEAIERNLSVLEFLAWANALGVGGADLLNSISDDIPSKIEI